MAQIRVNSFTSFDLSEDEELSGMILTLQQKQVIQNLISDIATTKLNITYDPGSPITFVQDEAFASGQLKAYQFLLDNSEAAEETMRTLNSRRPNQEE